MEILFSIIAGIFAIFAAIRGVKNRIRNTKFGAGSGIRNDRSRYNDLVSDYKRLERNKERVEELDARGADKLRECSKIGERIRKREQKADISE